MPAKEAETMLDVIRSPQPNLQTLKRAVSPSELKKALHGIVYDQIKAMWPNDEILAISLLFIDDVVSTKPDWKADDLGYFFKFIRQNQGNERLKVYGKLSSLALMQMVSVYEEEKSMHREQEYSGKKDNPVPHPSVLKVLKEVLDANKPEKKLITISPINKLHQSWLKHFDKLSRGKRFIKRFGKMMDVNEYMNHKQMQYNRVIDPPF